MTPSPKTRTEPPPSPVLNMQEAARYLRVSKTHLHRLIRGDMGTPPKHKRAGQRILLRKEWLDEWLEACS